MSLAPPTPVLLALALLATTLPGDGLGRPTASASTDGTVRRSFAWSLPGEAPSETETDEVTGLVSDRAFDPVFGEPSLHRLTGPDASVEEVVGQVRAPITRVTRAYSLTGEGARSFTRTEERDPAGRVLLETEPRGETTVSTEYRYDARGNVVEVRRGGETVWAGTYDAAGRLLAETDEAGQETRYTLDAAGRVVGQQGPLLNEVWTFVLATTGEVLSRTLTGVPETALTWSIAWAAGTETTTEPDGTTTARTYDGAGRLASEVVRSGGNDLQVRSAVTWDGELPTGETLVRGDGTLVTSATYDARGRETYGTESYTAPLGSYAYSRNHAFVGLNDTVTHTGPQAYQEILTYDAFGRARSRAVGELADERWYDALGLVTAERAAGEPLTEYALQGLAPRTATYGGSESTGFSYDGHGRLASRTGPDGITHATRYTRGSPGLVVTQSIGGVDVLAEEYGPRGLLVKSTPYPAAGTGETVHGYDPLGRLASVEMPSGATWRYTHDARTRRRTVTPPEAVAGAVEEEQGVDALGRPELRRRGTASWITTWNGDSYSTSTPTSDVERGRLDGRGRLVSRSYTGAAGSTLDLTEAVYGYGAADELRSVTETRPDGPVFETHGYDASLRWTSTARSFAPTVSASYVPGSRRRDTLTTDAGVRGYGYDALGRPTNVTTGPGASVSATWNPGGERLATVTRGGLETSFRYDALGREELRTTPGLTLSRAYQQPESGLVDSETAAFSGVSESTFYTYDADRRLTGATYPDGTVAGWKLDAAGRRTEERRSGPGFDETRYYTYAAGALSGIEREALEPCAPDAPPTCEPALRRVPESSYTHDAAGRRTGKTDALGTQEYTFDVDGRLLLATGPGAAPVVSYTYDHAGRRTSRTGPSGTTAYAWAEGELVEQQPGLNAPEPYLALGGELLAVGDAALVSDARGSVVGTASALGVHDLRRFDAWGGYRTAFLAPAGTLTYGEGSCTEPGCERLYGAPGTDEPAGFAGQRWDADAGLSYAEQRWYDPTSGLFLSEDPVQGDLFDPSTLHVWGYANGEPVRFTDPRGRSATVEGAALGLVWGSGQVLGRAFNEIVLGDEELKPNEYIALLAQNVIGGAELGLAMDLKGISGPLGLAVTGGLGGAGTDALTFSTTPQSWSEFAQGQVEGAGMGAGISLGLGAAGAVAGAGAKVAATQLGRFGVGRAALAHASRGSAWFEREVSARASRWLPRYARSEADDAIEAVDRAVLAAWDGAGATVASRGSGLPYGMLRMRGLSREMGLESGTARFGWSGDAARGGGGGTARVGRWMSEAEHEAMVTTGRVQESHLNGVSSVSRPGDPSAWVKQTTGTRYVEFDVPSSTVRGAGLRDPLISAVLPNENRSEIEHLRTST